MALIECKKCGQMISGQAEKCPKCGNLLSSIEDVRVGEYSRKQKRIGKTPIIVSCIVAFIVPLLSWIGSEEWDLDRLDMNDAIGFTILSITAPLLLFNLLLPFAKDKLGISVAFENYKRSSIICFFMIYLSALFVGDYNHHGVLSIGIGKELWWGESTVSFYILVLIEFFIGLILISAYSKFFSKSYVNKCIHIQISHCIALVLSCVITTIVYFTHDYREETAKEYTDMRFKVKENIVENIKGTHWKYTSPNNQSETPLEIHFSLDGKTAQILFNGKDYGYLKYDINAMTNKDNGRKYLCLDFEVGTLELEKEYGISYFKPLYIYRYGDSKQVSVYENSSYNLKADIHDGTLYHEKSK